MPKIILASSSPRRKELLSQLNIEFSTCSPEIDETKIEKETIIEYVIRMAKEKSVKGYEIMLKQGADDILVIGSDTVCDLDGELLSKPLDYPDSKRMLRKLSGRNHIIHTSYALYDGCDFSFGVVSSTVSITDISDSQILDYWNTDEPKDKAGSYAIQGLGAQFISRLEGSYSAVMGLPLYEIAKELKDRNINTLKPIAGIK